MPRPTAPLVVILSLLAGCSGDALLHGLAEVQANDVLVALEDEGVRATKARADGAAAGWTVSVAPGDAARARRLLAEHGLPRARPAGFGEVFAKGSMVPTPTEEHALYLHALGGELARSIEAIEGVVETRVHVGLPQPDPLRPGARGAPRAAVLVKCRAASCPVVRALEEGIRALVAGAADGLDPAAVSVVVTEARTASAPRPASPPRGGAPLLVGVAVVAGLAALVLGCLALRTTWRAHVRRETAR
jgi:type III secretion protein J